MKPLALFLSLVSYFLLGICLLILAIPGFIFFCMPAQWRYKSKAFFVFMHAAYWLMLKCTFLSITIKGAQNIPNEPVIIAVNHQSSLDVPLVGALMKGFPHVWLAWSELFDRPFLGHVAKKVALPINITTPMKAMRSLANALSVVQNNNMHAIIFPEGSRFVDGQIHEFFSGFVLLAKKTGRPVVPVCIIVAYKVYPPHAFIGYRHPITLLVGSPMCMGDHELEEEFKERVYQWFVEHRRG